MLTPPIGTHLFVVQGVRANGQRHYVIIGVTFFSPTNLEDRADLYVFELVLKPL